MGEGFRKFKRKVVFDALVKSVLVALSLGLTVFGGLFLLSKREVVGWSGGLCAVVGGGVSLLAGAICYLLFKPSDKRLARRLDRELALNEKVQTMVAFQRDDREMVELQRRNAEAILQSTPKSKIKFGRVWRYAVALSVAVVTFVASLAVPAISHVAADPPFNLTEYQKLRVQNLIEYVEQSAMVDDAKTYVVDELEGLVEALDTVSSQSVMKTYVIEAIVNVDKKVDEVNSYAPIRAALGNTADRDLMLLANALKTLQNSASKQAFNELLPTFAYPTFAEKAPQFYGKVAIAIATTNYTESDALYASTVAFMGGLQTLTANVADYTEETLETALTGVDGVFTKFGVAAHDALAKQKENRRTSDYVIDELKNIFGVKSNELPDLGEEELDYEVDKNGDGGNEQAPDDGGLGKGETEYGSNDVIYEQGKGYIKYGDVLDAYAAIIGEKVPTSELPEELRLFIDDYFASLYGKKKEDGAN